MMSQKKPAAELPIIPEELIDQMVSGPMNVEAVNAASMAFKKAVIERIQSNELSDHLGYSPSVERPGDAGNHRNGNTVLAENGPMNTDSPRGREAPSSPCSFPSTNAASSVSTTR